MSQLGEHYIRTGGNDSQMSDHLGPDMRKGQSNIMVAVRLRPLWQKEIEASNFSIANVLDDKIVVLHDPQDFVGKEGDALRKNRTRRKQYAFDIAFGEEVHTERVFELTTQFLCEGALNGLNSTVFAYGATGAGKTYTMLGNQANPGVMYHAMKELYTILDGFKADRDYKIRISFLEIYNENIRDLIQAQDQATGVGENNPDNFLELREDPLKGVCVAGLNEISVSNADEILSLLIHGNGNRTCEATGANETSSRSHAVFQIICEYTDRGSNGQGLIHCGKLSLIDLAGSERGARTQNRGIRMIEGANINRSLLALGNCINALHENSTKGQSNYIPYRDSKLTRLLKDSLGGNCRTVMIANIAPSNINYEETHNTLKYANRAKNIKTSVQRNVVNQDGNVAQYTDIISRLQAEVSDLKQQLAINGGQNLSIQAQQFDGKRPLDSSHSHHTNNSVILPTAQSEQPVNVSQFKQTLEAHFMQETKVKKRIHELDQKLETSKLTIVNKNNEIQTIEKNNQQANVSDMEISAQKQLITQLQQEISDIESKIKNFKIQLEQSNTKQRDLVGQRAQLKQSWQTSDLNHQQIELMKLMLRENILTMQNMDYQHQAEQQEIQLKIKEAQTYSLSEQVKLRDEVIERAKHMLDHSPEEVLTPLSRPGSISSRQENHANRRLDASQSPSFRDVSQVLTDDRILSLEQIIKQNSLLPPILESSNKANFYSHNGSQQNGVQSFQRGGAYNAAQRRQNNHISNLNNVYGSSNSRRRQQQQNMLVKKNFQLPAVNLNKRNIVNQIKSSPNKALKSINQNAFSANNNTGQSSTNLPSASKFDTNMALPSKHLSSNQTGLRQSTSTSRIQMPISKYPDLKRIQVGGGAVLTHGNSGLSPSTLHNRGAGQLKLSPKMSGGARGHSGSVGAGIGLNASGSANNLENSGNLSSTSLKPPLYTRGQSKIGSGVTRPFQYNNSGAKLQGVSNLTNSPSNQQTLPHSNQQNYGSRRLRAGPAGGSYGTLVGVKGNAGTNSAGYKNLTNAANYNNAQGPSGATAPRNLLNISPNQARLLEEAKRSTSVVSTGDSTNSNRSMPIRNRVGGVGSHIGLQQRRIGSGQTRGNSGIGAGLQSAVLNGNLRSPAGNSYMTGPNNYSNAINKYTNNMYVNPHRQTNQAQKAGGLNYSQRQALAGLGHQQYQLQGGPGVNSGGGKRPGMINNNSSNDVNVVK